MVMLSVSFKKKLAGAASKVEFISDKQINQLPQAEVWYFKGIRMKTHVGERFVILFPART